MKILTVVLVFLASLSLSKGESLRLVMEEIDEVFPSETKEEVARGNYGTEALDKRPNEYYAYLLKREYLKENEQARELIVSMGLLDPTDLRVAEALYLAYRDYATRTPIYTEKIILDLNAKYLREKAPTKYKHPETGEIIVPKTGGVTGRILNERRIFYGLGDDGKTLWGYEFDRGWYPIAPWEVGGPAEYEERLRN